ncbi:hypothetical protein P3X46_003897 [Hevea brasiliensis]|uniref:Uncharacterized protein n=2 Tax=Hevea brasiliensis TaxID=3981 RepID=A0ABQ9NA39_HEVBR|nr:hypothetical protein GH714_000122 [Hevea brasiliensis]KAJ9188547.1 hypothetical protein P3X46_003897 [Hevea brasiliensis]
MTMALALATAFLIILLATPAAYATQYVVGDSAGWTNFGVDYSTWASGKTFSVGDTLVFNYDGSTHKVAEVSQSDYNSCSASNALKTYSDGSTTIPLSKAGSMYFICPTAGHCSSGMQLSINVATPSGSTTPAPPSGSTTPSSGTPPTTGTASPPPPANNGAATTFCNMYSLILGSLLVLALLG